MLLAVGILAGRSWRSRLGFSALAFGIWDILYYVFLKVLCGWPHSLLDWDILFLLPLPWWGPVLAPVLISVLMIIWGTLAGCESTPRRGRCAESIVWVANVCGVFLALRVFMQDTLAVAKSGAEAVRHVLPLQFNWLLFGVALVMMSAPMVLAVITLFSKGVKNLDLVSVQEGVEEIPAGSTLSIVTSATMAQRPSLEG
jgi:hypothetical protein